MEGSPGVAVSPSTSPFPPGECRARPSFTWHAESSAVRTRLRFPGVATWLRLDVERSSSDRVQSRVVRRTGRADQRRAGWLERPERSSRVVRRLLRTLDSSTEIPARLRIPRPRPSLERPPRWSFVPTDHPAIAKRQLPRRRRGLPAVPAPRETGRPPSPGIGDPGSLPVRSAWCRRTGARPLAPRVSRGRVPAYPTVRFLERDSYRPGDPTASVGSSAI